MTTSSSEPLKLFYCYAHEDKILRDELDAHLSLMKRQGLVTVWYDREILEGEDPWLALGCFLHDWWCYAVDVRQCLIAEPPALATTLEGRRWVAFCAATVEELCNRTSLPCPAWTQQQDYFLEYPWFYFSQQSQRDWLLLTTPEAFKRHNVFVGGSVLDNKYELQQVFGSKPKWTLWSDQELQNYQDMTNT